MYDFDDIPVTDPKILDAARAVIFTPGEHRAINKKIAGTEPLTGSERVLLSRALERMVSARIITTIDEALMHLAQDYEKGVYRE